MVSIWYPQGGRLLRGTWIALSLILGPRFVDQTSMFAILIPQLYLWERFYLVANDAMYLMNRYQQRVRGVLVALITKV